MKIYLRIYNSELLELMLKIESIIKNNSDFEVFLIDHSNKEEIIKKAGFLNLNLTVSIDKYLSEVLNIPYVQLSRVFNLKGEAVSRVLYGFDEFKCGPNWTILDTDIATGQTIKIAKRLHNTNKYFTLIELKDNEDLIDIEDFVYDLSFFEINNKIVKGNYLINEDVFEKRTSLPRGIYKNILEQVNEFKSNR